MALAAQGCPVDRDGCGSACGVRSLVERIGADGQVDRQVTYVDARFSFTNIAFGDVDGDDTMDAVFASSDVAGLALVRDVADGAGQVERLEIDEGVDADGDIFPNTRGTILADIDADGDLDLIALHSGPPAVLVFINDGAARFSFEARSANRESADHLLATDLDGEAPRELLAQDEINGELFLIAGRADADLGRVEANDVLADDIDADGDNDLWANDKVAAILWRNDGTGRLEREELPPIAGVVAFSTTPAEVLVVVDDEASVVSVDANGRAGDRRVLGARPRSNFDCASCNVCVTCDAVLVDLTGDGTRDAVFVTLQGTNDEDAQVVLTILDEDGSRTGAVLTQVARPRLSVDTQARLWVNESESICDSE